MSVVFVMNAGWGFVDKLGCGFEVAHFDPAFFLATSGVDREAMPESAYQNQLRALRRRKRTSRVGPREGGGERDRERLRVWERERVKDHVRGLRGADLVEVEVRSISSIRLRFEQEVEVASGGRAGRQVTSGEVGLTLVSMFSVVETRVPSFTVNAAEKDAGVPLPNVKPGPEATDACGGVWEERNGTKPEPEEEKGRRETNLRRERVRERDRLRFAVDSCCLDASGLDVSPHCTAVDEVAGPVVALASEARKEFLDAAAD